MTKLKNKDWFIDKILKIISTEDKVLILIRGLPGIGKSTTMHNIAKMLEGIKGLDIVDDNRSILRRDKGRTGANYRVRTISDHVSEVLMGGKGGEVFDADMLCESLSALCDKYQEASSTNDVPLKSIWIRRLPLNLGVRLMSCLNQWPEQWPQIEVELREEGANIHVYPAQLFAWEDKTGRAWGFGSRHLGWSYGGKRMLRHKLKEARKDGYKKIIFIGGTKINRYIKRCDYLFDCFIPEEVRHERLASRPSKMQERHKQRNQLAPLQESFRCSEHYEIDLE